MGKRFTAADAYLFTIVGWSGYAKVDLAPYPAVRAFMDRVGARPAVQAAIAEFGGEVVAVRPRPREGEGQ